MGRQNDRQSHRAKELCAATSAQSERMNDTKSEARVVRAQLGRISESRINRGPDAPLDGTRREARS